MITRHTALPDAITGAPDAPTDAGVLSRRALLTAAAAAGGMLVVPRISGAQTLPGVIRSEEALLLLANCCREATQPALCDRMCAWDHRRRMTGARLETLRAHRAG